MGIFDGFGYEPPAQDNNNVAKSLDITENLVIGGVQYQNPLINGAVSGTSKNGVPLPMYPDFETSSMSLEQDRAARSQGNDSDIYRVAETFDMRNANTLITYTSGQARANAIYIPYRQKLEYIEDQMGDYNVGGTYTAIQWNLYGPLAADPSTGFTPLTALPYVTGAGQVFGISAVIRDSLIGSAGDTGGGLFQQQAITPVDVGPGVYYMVSLLVSSVAPGTPPTFVGHIPASGLGSVYSRNNASNVQHAYFLNGQTNLPPAALDLTAYTATSGKQWFALSTDSSII